MLARLQQFTTLALLGAAIVWAGWFLREGEPAWAVVGALMILFFYALVLGLEFVMLAFVHGNDAAPRASAAQLCRAWWGEVRSAPIVFCWRQPFRSQAEPDHLLPTAPGRRGAVLVHGFVCNRGLWNPWLRRLRARGVPFVAVNLEPVFGTIDSYAAIVDAAVRRVEAATGCAPVVVAHSMGGLAVRAWLHVCDADTRVHRVVTIASPHAGTWLARFAFVPNARQMRLSNAWLQHIAAGESVARRALFTCFYGHCDNIVFPPSTATLAGADNRHVPGTAHVHMAACELIFDEVCRWVDSPVAARRAAPPEAA